MPGQRKRREERRQTAKAIAALKRGERPRLVTGREARERADAAIERDARKPRRYRTR